MAERHRSQIAVTDASSIQLSRSDLQAVAGYAAACARHALPIFENDFPADRRPRLAIEAAQAFADGGERTKAIRDAAWAAQRAAHEARDKGHAPASMAARAAMAAAGAAFLHPLARSTQVKHILGSAAYAVRAHELVCPHDESMAEQQVERLRAIAPSSVIHVLRLYPPAPPGGGRAGDIIRQLDKLLR